MNILQHNSQAIINHLRDHWQDLHVNDNDPLTTDQINALQYPDQGVKDRLNTAYQQYQLVQNQGERMRNNAKTRCKELQKATIDSYAEQCHSWKQKNERWRAAYALRLIPQQQQQQQQQQPTLEQEVDQYGVAIQQLQQQIQQLIGPQQNNGIRIGHVNIRSLLTRNLLNGERPDKFDNLQIILSAHRFHVFVVGESWVKGVDSQLLAIPGYNMYRLDRDYSGPSCDHGGLLVYVRDNIGVQFGQCHNLPVYGNNGTIRSLLQYLDLEVQFDENFPRIRVVAVYNPPYGGNGDAMLCVHQQGNPTGLLPLFSNLPEDTVILGDVNIDICGNNYQDYQNFVSNNLGFLQCIHEPTRINGTLLDHIYFKGRPQGQGAFITEAGVIPPGNGFQLGGFADHKIIYCTVGNSQEQNFQTPQNKQPHRFNQQPQRKQQELNNGNYNNALNLNWV